jgi:hypothetical protein
LALSFGKPKQEDVVALIAAKKYGRAIELLKAQLNKRGASHTVRKQLADVLVLAGKTSEAVALLLPLADEFARDGFAAKAVSILKKVQKLDPSRRDVPPPPRPPAPRPPDRGEAARGGPSILQPGHAQRRRTSRGWR